MRVLDGAWPCLTRWQACSRNRKPSGGRRTSIAFRALRSSTRWTVSAPILTIAFARCDERLAAHPVRLQFPIGKEDNFIGVIDFIEQKAIVWLEDTLGAKFEVLDVEKLWDEAF